MQTGVINEEQMRAAVLCYQQTGGMLDGQRALALADPLIRGMLARAATVRMDPDDAYTRLQWKVWRAFRSYRPESGRVFSYLNTVVQNFVRSLCQEQLRQRESVSLDEEETLEFSVDGFHSREKMEDLHFQLRRLTTICIKTNEIEAQRWLVKSLLQSDFTLPRHEAVRALRIVFAVDLREGRLIHDRTLLELRRTLLEQRRVFPKVNFIMLRDKRERGLLKWKPYLSTGDFAKLVYLLRGLAPVIVGELIDRELRQLNGDGTPEKRQQIIRNRLCQVLNGFPEARPLFPGKVI